MTDVSYINPIGLGFLIIICVIILFVKRQYLLIPMFLVLSYMTLGQQFLVAGLHITIMRFVFFLGWVRLVVRREIVTLKFNTIDRYILLWVASNVILYVIHNQTTSALVNRLGFAYNALGIYFFFRFVVKDFEETIKGIKVLVIVIVPLAVLMSIEFISGYNLFSVFGGVDSLRIRDGRIRCYGPFASPILAGTYGATLVPFFAGLWFNCRSKLFVLIGILAATVITVTSSSSGPLMAYLSGIIALALWPLREKMKMIRWGVFMMLIMLNYFMNAPVWYLFTKISNITGGTGWHRSYLIDQAIKNIGSWWISGTNYTAHWFPYNLKSTPGMVDITNQYILEGVNGGLLTMFLFIMIIISCFRMIGEARKNNTAGFTNQHTILFWAIGSSIFAHAITFFSVSYFDQIIILWYFTLAIVSSVTNVKEVGEVSRVCTA